MVYGWEKWRIVSLLMGFVIMLACLIFTISNYHSMSAQGWMNLYGGMFVAWWLVVIGAFYE